MDLRRYKRIQIWTDGGLFVVAGIHSFVIIVKTLLLFKTKQPTCNGEKQCIVSKFQ